MTRKQRLTITVDPELVAAGNRAVAEGAAESLSAWVSAALAERVRRDRKLDELGAAISDYEAEFGEITTDEMRLKGELTAGTLESFRGRRPSQPRSVSRGKSTRSA